MRGLNIDGSWNEDPLIIKEDVRRYFEEGFDESNDIRPLLDGATFNTTSLEENNMLVGFFEEAYIKEVISECGNQKSLGPDGFNVKLMKEFWDVMKNDIVRFVRESHIHGCPSMGYQCIVYCPNS